MYTIDIQISITYVSLYILLCRHMSLSLRDVTPHVAALNPCFIYTPWSRKKDQFSLVCILFSTRKKLVNVFTYIRPRESGSISYNSVYLILAYVDNFAVTETLNIFTARCYASAVLAMGLCLSGRGRNAERPECRTKIGSKCRTPGMPNGRNGEKWATLLD